MTDLLGAVAGWLFRAGAAPLPQHMHQRMHSAPLPPFPLPKTEPIGHHCIPEMMSE